MEKLISFLGIFVMVFLAWLMSEDRKAINWRLVITGILMQLGFAVIILMWEPGKAAFQAVSDVVNQLLSFTEAGSTFLFGGLITTTDLGYIFALKILPTIIFFSSFMAILYYTGIMELIVKGMAKVMLKLLGTSGAESLSAAANIFVGQTEAPLMIKPFISSMTKSELLTIMTGGMATVAGGVMAGYAQMGVDIAHLISASIMSAPASLIIAKIMIPETEEPATKGEINMKMEKLDANLVDAASRGAAEGLNMALNVGAMLLAFIALVAMVNAIVGWAGGLVGIDGLSLEIIFGYLFAPFAFVMGVPASEVLTAGNILGQKVIVNEFVAYINLGTLISEGAISERTIVILTYALCGFANFSSIGIQVGGIGSLAPERRHDIAKLGFRAMIGGCLAAFMTATVAGILV